MAEERRGDPDGKSGIRGLRSTGQKKAGWQFHAEEISRPMTKDEKAARLTRLMKKGYRKGYRVPKRPKRGGSDRKKNRNPYRQASRMSGSGR